MDLFEHALSACLSPALTVSCFLQRLALRLSHTVASAPTANLTNAVSAISETLLDLPEHHIPRTRQATPQSDFEKGDVELQQ